MLWIQATNHKQSSRYINQQQLLSNSTLLPDADLQYVVETLHSMSKLSIVTQTIYEIVCTH